MSDNFDCYNAPQYIDFQTISDDVGDVDKFFDVPYELHPGPDEGGLSKTQDLKDEDGDKENSSAVTTPAKKRRSKSAPPLSEIKQINFADVSAYQTPGTSKRKSQIAFMNGRSLLVQNYDGITIATPNKTHIMETRLDFVIKSPGLALRSRSIQRTDQKNESELSTDNQLNRSTRKSRRCAHENAQETATLAEESHENSPAPIEQETESVAVQPPVKPTRVKHQAPMVAKHPEYAMSRKRPNEDQLPNKAVKFMAAAEMVHHFQKDTPERFHSRPARTTLQNKMHIRKPSASRMLPRNNTIPKSPFLNTKVRQLQKHHPHIPTQKEREEAELQEIKEHQVKANPLDWKVLIPPVNKTMLAVKTPTKFEPFKLSQGKRKEPTPEPMFKFKAQPVPRRMLSSPKGVPPKNEMPLTEPQSPALVLMAKYPKRVKVETPGNIEKEIGHFGIQNKQRSTPTRNTKVQPFSFEERDRQMLLRKQDLIQKQLEEDRKTREFKANKKPHFAAAPVLPEKKRMPITVAHAPHLSAYTMGAHQQQKFKDKIAAEMEQQHQQALFKARPVTVTQKQPFVPVLPKRTLQDITQELQLYTEKRAANRAKFDEMVKLKEEDMVRAKAEMEAQREAEENEEQMRQRREAEFHANPLNIRSPPKIEPSSKPLTEPMTPHLLVEKRANRSRIMQ